MGANERNDKEKEWRLQSRNLEEIIVGQIHQQKERVNHIKCSSKSPKYKKH